MSLTDMKMRLGRLGLFAALILFASAATIPACGGGEPAEMPPPVDYSNHPIYSKYKFGDTDDTIDIGIQPLYLPTGIITEAIRRDNILRDSLSKLGLNLRLHPFLKGDDVNFFLRSGDLEGGIGGDMSALTAAGTLDVVIPALIQQGFCAVVAEHPMLIEELRGKRIGYAFGSNAHYALLNALALAELTESDVTLVPMDATDMPRALREGRINAFSAWEPTPTLALAADENAVVIHRSLSSGYLYFTRAFSEKHPEALREIVAAEIRALAWLHIDKANLLKAAAWDIAADEALAGDPTLLTAQRNAELAKVDILSFGAIPYIPETSLAPQGRLHREYEFLRALNKLPRSARWDKVRSSFDRAIIEEIASEGRRYRLDEFDYSEGGAGADG